MANKKISALTALTAPASGDLSPLVDVSDTSDAASGTTKKVTLLDLLKEIFGSLAVSSDISPAQITANQNDYNPTGLSTAAVLRLSTDASRNITSIAGGADGRILIIHNVGSFDIVLKDEDGATGTAANRLALSGDVTLTADQCAILQYDSTTTRWRCIAASRATTGAGSGDVVGPSSATDNALVRFDSTTGKLIQDSTVTLDDTGALTVPEMAAPATPAAGKVSVYAKADGKLYIKDDAGTETDLTATGAGGAETGANSDITSMDGLTGALQYPTQIDFTEGVAPGTPAANKVSLYAKADGLLYSKDDAGAETLVSGGAGGGGSYAGVTTGGTGSLDMAQGTKTANEPFIDGSVTWNSAGVTFQGIVLNATDTASAAASTLIDVKRNTSTVFSVSKSGAVSIPTSGSTITIAQNGSYGFSGGAVITSGPSSSASSGTVLFSTTWAGISRNYTAPSGSTNDPDFGGNTYLYRITPNAAGSTLTGGRDIAQSMEMHEITNVGSAPLTLANNNSGSSAGRRWLTANNLDMRIAPNQKAFYLYDGTSNNHRIGKCETSETLNVTTQFDKTNTTLADVTGLSIGVQASRTYNFRAVLFVDADATGGYKIAIGGTATATAIVYQINAVNNATGLFTITSRQTALAGAAGAATGTGLVIEIEGTITVNAAGTLTVQFAQNAANGTSSVLVGSTLMVNNIN